MVSAWMEGCVVVLAGLYGANAELQQVDEAGTIRAVCSAIGCQMHGAHLRARRIIACLIHSVEMKSAVWVTSLSCPICHGTSRMAHPARNGARIQHHFPNVRWITPKMI